VAARRAVARRLQEHGLSERQALRLVGMSASTLRYRPCGDGNAALRERLRELAGQHRRHGYRMLHSRLRIDGWAINVKRTYRIYREEGLMVRKRRRKKLPVPERQPLLRPTLPNEVWSMDFLFDELATGRRVKTLTVVDDCSKESVQIIADTSIPALYVTRVLDQVKAERGLPRVIRTDNWPESQVARCRHGRRGTASNCASSSQASRCKTPTSRASTAGSAMSACHSTGSPA
jgi:transposase InsO family protein